MSLGKAPWIMALSLGVLGPVPPAIAADGPVVVELFTSQGCSSCPPADALMAKIAMKEDVLPLALHVDYWDYIGWPDTFADPAFTERQKGYAAAAGENRIYTPQMMVGGVDAVVGARPGELLDLMKAHAATPYPVELAVSRDGAALRIEASLDGAPRPMVVVLFAYRPSETVEIEAGENVGRVIDYHNIVDDMQVLTEWDGRHPLTIEAELDGKGGVVVQEDGHGKIVGAAKLD